MRTYLAPEEPSTDLFMDTIIARVHCPKHKADSGEPCWSIGIYGQICNRRAKRAGFNHKISEKSLRLTRYSKKR